MQIKQLTATCTSLQEENIDLQNQLAEVEQTCTWQLEQTAVQASATKQLMSETIKKQSEEKKKILELVSLQK